LLTEAKYDDRLTLQAVEESVGLRRNRHWRAAVWSLRVGFCALGVVLIGLIVIAIDSDPWILAIGVIAWLVAAITTAAEFMKARNELTGSKPGFWSVRSMLLHDTMHASSTTSK
jgi:hypothetical protein